MKTNGWIKLHRQLLDNPLFKNHKLLQTFLYCLLKATHDDYQCLVGDSIVNLKAGQLATGRKAISRSTNLTEQEVRTALSKLEKLDILTINPTSKYSIISITNWNTHQLSNQQVTNNQPTSNQQVTTNKNINNIKNNKNTKDLVPVKPSPAKKYKYSDWDMDFCQQAFSLITQDIPNAKQPNYESWANDCRKMRELDNRPKEEMIKLWEWVRQDSFWHSNILSMSKFKSKYDQLLLKSGVSGNGQIKTSGTDNNQGIVGRLKNKQPAVREYYET